VYPLQIDENSHYCPFNTSPFKFVEFFIVTCSHPQLSEISVYRPATLGRVYYRQAIKTAFSRH